MIDLPERRLRALGFLEECEVALKAVLAAPEPLTDNQWEKIADALKVARAAKLSLQQAPKKAKP